MTSRRERLTDYIRHGGEECMVSLQIGGGAGFDAKIAGKEWVSETTVEDTMEAYDQVGGDALINLGLPGFDAYAPTLAWRTERVSTKGERITRSTLDTPYGPLCWEHHERPRQGATPVQYPLHFGDSLEPVLWLVDQQFAAMVHVPDMVGPLLEQVHPEWPVCIQWSVQPFELLCLTPASDAVLFAMHDGDRYRAVCDRIRDLNIALCKEVIRAGADFIFLGGPGRELMSPFLYETYMVPDSQRISEAVHNAGGLVYSHICSPIQPFLDMGYYGRMGLDLFETLSPPPVGNVTDLAAARRALPQSLCTRGNIGLDLLLSGTPEDVHHATLKVIEATKDNKHFVAASDYLFYDVPLENVRAIVETVADWNQNKPVVTQPS